MSDLRPVAPILLPSDVAPATPPTAAPELVWVRPDQLLINSAYQRSLSERSMQLIQRIVGHFDWRHLKPPVVTRCGESDTYEVIDGQHTAIAAATHGGIDRLPALLISVQEIEDRARSFLSHNRDRVAMSATQLFFAAVAAGDEDALTIAQVCERAGARILRLPPSNGRFRAGDTMAVSVLRMMVRRRSAMSARIIVETCVKAGATPVTSDLLKSVEELLHGPNYAGEIAAEDLVSTIMRADEFSARITEMSIAKSMPRWRAQTIVFYQNTRKKRRA